MIWALILSAAGDPDPTSWLSQYGPGFAICIPVIIYLERSRTSERKACASERIALSDTLTEVTTAYHDVLEKSLVAYDKVNSALESSSRTQLNRALEEIAESHRLLREATGRRPRGDET